MYRAALEYLKAWKGKSNRKPLVIRGARQVGKSYLVRSFARQCEYELFEINFEQDHDTADCFLSKHPDQILSLLELKHGQKIVPGKTLLFLDEIQATPRVFSSLRYFYEQVPGIHVVAAGSLLEFVLENHTFSMPVGRIEYLHLGPMTFKEFLGGINRENLAGLLEAASLVQPVPDVLHKELMQLFRLYLFIGGMPESIGVYADSRSLLEVDAVKHGILQTYQDDFNKYGQRVDPVRIRKVFMRLPFLVGNKLKYVHLDAAGKSTDLKKVLHLLALAKVYYPVFHSSANGIPLGAQYNEKFQKPLFLDVGLLMSACGMRLGDIQTLRNTALVNSGALCEQFIGQHLLYRNPMFMAPELFYWCREKRQASSEIDYVISLGTTVIPVEVKAGKTGTLKSLHVFVKEKRLKFGLRFNADMMSLAIVPLALPHVKGAFSLLSLPLYMVEETDRLLKESVQRNVH